jgi:hypothetical protein
LPASVSTIDGIVVLDWTDHMTIDQARQEKQKQKELPTLSPNIQRIPTACEDHDSNQEALAGIREVAAMFNGG